MSAAGPTALRIRQVTRYRYSQPVRFGEHRVLFRPREGHDVNVADADVEVNVESDVRWIHDVFSNSVAVVAPRAEAAELRFECQVRLTTSGAKNLELPLEARALKLPVAYNAEERQVLAPYLAAVDDDPTGAVALWAKGFCASTDATREVIGAMMAGIRDGFQYQAREADGTQPAARTLDMKVGTCRDYAWLMIEALRSIGIACRFVTGYIYDPSLDAGGLSGASADTRTGADAAARIEDRTEARTKARTEARTEARTGSGATHAWLQVYLPGAGWVPYDPTNRLTGGHDLIRVGYSRRPQEAVPLAGSWFGDSGSFLGMQVEVSVERD